MAATKTIEISLPDGIEATSSELEYLKAACQAMVLLRSDQSHIWERIARQLEEDGWSVTWGLRWVAEARRDSEYEQASGKSLDEALFEVSQLVRLDMASHIP
jgi:hypothetical protein